MLYSAESKQYVAQSSLHANKYIRYYWKKVLGYLRKTVKKKKKKKVHVLKVKQKI